MPGYCLASVDKDIISHRFLCNFCGFLLREAMQTSCGHHYCQSCLRSLIRMKLTRDLSAVLHWDPFGCNKIADKSKKC
ncbi:hypothetical protein pdam_00021547 [Pocillopora damicornis]|uniref:Zinc finger C3HC4 RING-type domain-containing protein n=1 Tax=Pocillopora damicornis TaxID=46731 RepID=A0A3M6V361_POCDA|nr:hypothetical protein pdam_00021547 [Pocillopora damicornis]